MALVQNANLLQGHSIKGTILPCLEWVGHILAAWPFLQLRCLFQVSTKALKLRVSPDFQLTLSYWHQPELHAINWESWEWVMWKLLQSDLRHVQIYTVPQTGLILWPQSYLSTVQHSVWSLKCWRGGGCLVLVWCWAVFFILKSKIFIFWIVLWYLVARHRAILPSPKIYVYFQIS